MTVVVTGCRVHLRRSAMTCTMFAAERRAQSAIKLEKKSRDGKPTRHDVAGAGEVTQAQARREGEVPRVSRRQGPGRPGSQMGSRPVRRF